MVYQNSTIPMVSLRSWVKDKYRGKTIKKTEEPYYHHLSTISKMAGRRTAFGAEIGLCHDLLEDTTVTADELMATLVKFGYEYHDAFYITSVVKELTDVFTEAAFPELRKRERKAMETKRLLTISPGAQTVKYCDLIYNIGWMLANNRKKAKKYLKEKKWLVDKLDKGNDELQKATLQTIKMGMKELSHK